MYDRSLNLSFNLAYSGSWSNEIISWDDYHSLKEEVLLKTLQNKSEIIGPSHRKSQPINFILPDVKQT